MPSPHIGLARRIFARLGFLLGLCLALSSGCTPGTEITKDREPRVSPTTSTLPIPTSASSPSGSLSATFPVTTPPRLPSAKTTSAPHPSRVASPTVTKAMSPVVYETSLSLMTYDYQSALLPTTPDDPVYPYPRLDHNKVGPPSPRTYRALVLENRYLQLTILPELGGRLYRWVDKASGHNLFYSNPVLKPTHWGIRGWWLATGGMEWALPLDEHGLSEATPWHYTIERHPDRVSVSLRDVEEHSGLVCTITVQLDDQHSYFTLIPQITNPTRDPVRYKFWINGMFSLGSPQAEAGLQFILPVDRVMVHSSGDKDLPGPGKLMTWPEFRGRDMSRASNWQKYLGVFAYPAITADFMGAYNHQTHLGVVRVFPHPITRGAKIFSLGDIPAAVWTDDESRYFELWAGLAPTFWDEVTLAPGQTVSWQEYWYSVNHTGGFTYANEQAALNLALSSTTVEVAAAVTSALEGPMRLWHNGRVTASWNVSLTPGQAFRRTLEIAPAQSAGVWKLELRDDRGRQIAMFREEIGRTTRWNAR
ncbi:MAG: hypothetical protein DDG58_06790 [Ardenticatenia bacterium]|nr:MAG: hypothetical protein DDG58_06790 [Ardenticatenia bacterium]